MNPFGTDPQQFIADFVTSFHDGIVHGDEDLALVFDRYHTPDVVQTADGHRMDRAKLLAHTRPVRKNKPGIRVEVHEAQASGDRLTARYTLHVHNRKKDLAIEVYYFGQFAEDGRLRQAHMLTRTLPSNDA